MSEERVRKHIEESEDEEEDDNNNNNQLERRIVVNSPHDSEPDYLKEGVVMDDHTRKREELETRMSLALKRKQGRRMHRDEEDLEQMLDDKILRLKDEMTLAAQRDMETIEKRINDDDDDDEDEQEIDNGGMDDDDEEKVKDTEKTKSIQPAMEKIKLLPKVASVLNKVNLADTILDNNLLQAVKFWLEPLPDGSLPSFEIQKTLIQALEHLPIKTEHLKESGLGKVMSFYTKSNRVEPKLKRLVEKIVAEWTRPIIGASDNYRDMRIMKIDFDQSKFNKKSTQELKKNLARQVLSNNSNGLSSGSSNTGGEKKLKKSSNGIKKPKSLYEQAQVSNSRTTIPQQTTTDYKYAPVSNIELLKSRDLSIKSTGVGSSLNNSELYKRINSRLTNNKKKNTRK